jgi:hypothetical protein
MTFAFLQRSEVSAASRLPESKSVSHQKAGAMTQAQSEKEEAPSSAAPAVKTGCGLMAGGLLTLGALYLLNEGKEPLGIWTFGLLAFIGAWLIVAGLVHLIVTIFGVPPAKVGGTGKKV